MTEASHQPPQPSRASYVLHIASVAGLHREGRKPFPVGDLELVRLMDDVLDLFDSEPRFHHFTLDGQAVLLEDYLSIRPENFERIEQAVQDGRLLTGPWYVLPEPSTASMELLIRNLMLGLRTARVFGRPLMVGYLPYPHAVLPGQLPQILKGFGIDTAIVLRRDEAGSLETIWEGIDGTQIVLGRAALLTAGQPITALRQSLAPYSQAGHLLLLDALNPLETIQIGLPEARRLLHDDIFHSSPDAYAKAIAPYSRANKLPIIRSEPCDPCAQLPDEHEQLLTQWIEPCAVWAENSTEGKDKIHLRLPRTLIQRLWRDLLRNQNPYLLQEIRQCADYVMQKHVPLLAGGVSSLSASARLVQSSDAGFCITAVKLPEEAERSGMIVRGHSTGGEPLWITLEPWRAFATVEVVTLDEAPTGGKLAPESNGAVRFKAAPHRILTFWFHD